jgi:hypothetical protein
MVKTNIKNKIVDVKLTGNESVTVPNNEVWEVRISGNVNDFPEVFRNGDEILRLRRHKLTQEGTFVFSGSDTISINESDEGNVHISGAVVN